MWLREAATVMTGLPLKPTWLREPLRERKGQKNPNQAEDWRIQKTKTRPLKTEPATWDHTRSSGLRHGLLWATEGGNIDSSFAARLLR